MSEQTPSNSVMQTTIFAGELLKQFDASEFQLTVDFSFVHAFMSDPNNNSTHDPYSSIKPLIVKVILMVAGGYITLDEVKKLRLRMLHEQHADNITSSQQDTYEQVMRDGNENDDSECFSGLYALFDNPND